MKKIFCDTNILINILMTCEINEIKGIRSDLIYTSEIVIEELNKNYKKAVANVVELRIDESKDLKDIYRDLLKRSMMPTSKYYDFLVDIDLKNSQDKVNDLLKNMVESYNTQFLEISKEVDKINSE